MHGHQDTANFIKSFTGSHHFVLDYLIEEVLHQQPESVQTFLLRTSILDRMCGPLCDAVLGSLLLQGRIHWNTSNTPICSLSHWITSGAGIAITIFLAICCASVWENPKNLPNSTLRASQWYEENDDLDAAFHHAITAGDFSRAAGLAEAAWQGHG